ncbi:MAG: TlyA family RNA methyltransferase [Clostridia bacterium]|nr:TlyA family RNA methyltransferase [Clostridia bacterium]
MRLDKAIFLRNLTQSRSRAEQLISSGAVAVNGKTVYKSAFEVNDDDEISVQDIGYVGRGGLKLEHALDSFSVDCKNVCALDIGASTGGFTECLLKRGAKSVVAVDVGHGQMHPKLVQDERVILLENTNAKDLTVELIGGKKDICVMDVSFISQTEIYPAMFSCLKEEGIAITLVKPQFEAGRKFLSKKGIVKDKKVFFSVLEKIEASANQFGFGVENACASPVLGGDGNKEFLVLLQRNADKFDFTKIIL